MNRRKILLAGACVAVGAAGGGAYALVGGGSRDPAPAQRSAEPQARPPQMAAGGGVELYPDDRILGASDSPIVMIEYASLTCPHCASFHADVLPELKDPWVTGGKVRFVYRHFPLDQLALRAAALANCFSGDQFFGFVDLLFQTQRTWSSAADPLAELRRIAGQAGLDAATADACMTDEAEITKILEQRVDAQQTFDVQATPTVIVNGRKLRGGGDVPTLTRLFEELAPSG